ncbi:MAG TPA: HIT family protein, partial [Rickettsiales bacterium]|nr:HIT family protein [Rickettsiales bacterium]
MDKCFFCKFEKGLINEEKILDGKLAYIIADGNPVTKYHSLIIPKRHFDSFFEITNEELLEINELIKIRKDEILKLDPTVAGFNVGINIGEFAGQS